MIHELSLVVKDIRSIRESSAMSDHLLVREKMTMRINRVQDLKLLNVKDTEECAKDRHRWKQYVVVAMGLKGR